MFYIMLAALVMLFAGTFFSEKWARENPLRFFCYWLTCAWLTLTGMLLALFDILLIRAATRAKRRKLEQEILGKNDEPK